ncbi:MFS transporter [Phenylobacterium aquaticum]|uniref:MFS transporter n=1 Tax=Phenylobacterium aquaticum TaxID=1763816 RepID=UPI001F5C64EC|nr:MFS transporter [Phenylobacterium aquaticum]MCI3131183.1 hypothetical protein [Phenylobacterium aquaticum]
MGLANLPFGLWGGLTLVTIPQLLAARGVPEPLIASITAAAMIPTFCGFLVAPILDVGLSRRTYAVIFGLLTAALAVLAITQIAAPVRLAPLMIAGFLSANLFYNALGGWLSNLVDPGDEGRLASSFTIGNIAGFGLGAIAFISLLRSLPPQVGALAVGAIIALPLLLILAMPPASRERRTAQESFGALFRDLAVLVRQPLVLRTALLFLLPAASFALTNTLGGLGHAFRASESFVAIVAGIGVTVAGIAGASLTPILLRKAQPLSLYLAIGGMGALFTLALIVLPATPAVFALAVVGQNVFQSAAFAVESTIVFRTIGEGNPLAATQFGLLQAMTCAPIIYMQAVDGHAYGAGGLTGMFLADAGLSLAACALLLPLVLRWRRRAHDRLGGVPAPQERGATP